MPGRDDDEGFNFDDMEESTPAPAEETADAEAPAVSQIIFWNDLFEIISKSIENAVQPQRIIQLLNQNWEIQLKWNLFFHSLLLKKALPDENDAPIDYDEAATAAAAADLPEADVPPPEDDAHRRPITLYRHWVR